MNQLPADSFPDFKQLNSLLRGNALTASDAPVRFVCSSSHAHGDYENRIFTTGQVSTRPESWHDLFNALAWLRFPRIKSAINSMHFNAKTAKDGRGPLRDALTLFDECGVILVSNRKDLLLAVAQRDWHRAFQIHAGSWHTELIAATFGHAMLEKYLTPYKSMTANALLIHIDSAIAKMPRSELLALLDSAISEKFLADGFLKTPGVLAPLPLAGIPGWNFCGPQTDEFYADKSVFRPAPDDLEPPPILHIDIQ